MLRGAMHRLHIERLRHAPCAAKIEREVGAAVDDAIKVMPLDGGEARLESVGHDFRAQHGDRIGAQMRVHRVAHLVGTERLCQVEMRDLPLRMDAGIGAARAMHAHIHAAQPARGTLQRALHRRIMVLNLPAAKRRAVIFDGELVARHQSSPPKAAA